MSVNKVNVVKTNGVDWEYEVSAGEDKPTGFITYTDDFLGWASRCPLVNSAHPDIPGLKLERIKAKRIEGDQIKVDLFYVAMAFQGVPGKPDQSENATAKYYVQVNSREEHILSNPYAAGLDSTEREALFAISNGTLEDGGGNKYEVAVTSTEGVELLEKIKKGNVSYLLGTIIFGQRKVIKNISELNIENFGKRNKPPDPPGISLGGTLANWLYTSAAADPVPTDEVAWQADRQWTYSPEGWDEQLYTSPEE